MCVHTCRLLNLPTARYIYSGYMNRLKCSHLRTERRDGLIDSFNRKSAVSTFSRQVPAVVAYIERTETAHISGVILSCTGP